MNKPVIPFTLEQEANYRKQIQDLLAKHQFRGIIAGVPTVS